MRKPRLRFLLAASFIVVAGLAAFVIGRYAFSEDAPAGAQIDPSGTPVIVEKPPHPSIAAAMTAIAEDNTKPVFTGVLNGFTFIGEGTPFPRTEGGCSNSQLRELSSSEARTAIRGSALDFQASDLPNGLRLVRETATVCDDEVVAVGRVYEGSGDRLLSIVRTKSAPVFPAVAPKDRLSSLTIRGRPSVLVTPIDFSPTIIIMRDDEGTLWTINAEEMDVDETRKVTEGVK
jgi:hypothetical protein